MEERRLAKEPETAVSPSLARRSALGDDRGIALITAVIILLVLFVLGTSLIVLTGLEFKIAKTNTANIQALYVADGGIQHIIAEQNDLTRNPRYLFDSSSYDSLPLTNPFVESFELRDPDTGTLIGIAQRQVVNDKNPLYHHPPYRVRSEARAVAGPSATVKARRVVEADVAPISLLQYAVYSEDNISFQADITVNGKVYSGKTISLLGPNVVFNDTVEYVTALNGESFGTFKYGKILLSQPKAPLTALVDLEFFELASKEEFRCGDPVGLYIGADKGAENLSLFERSKDVYQVDLTLFDFTGAFQDPPQPITYNGEVLLAFDTGSPITAFSGVIFVDGELHIWGINGGRSTEDREVPDIDGVYDGPSGMGNNLYSNNRLDYLEDLNSNGVLDPGEDKNSNGVLDDTEDVNGNGLLDAGEDLNGNGMIDTGEDLNGNGILDPAGRGMSLTFATPAGSDIIIDHNIFMGRSPAGSPVNIALVSGDAIKVDANSPKATHIEAALVALSWDYYVYLGYNYARSWIGEGSSGTHRDNHWALLRGDGDSQEYVFDLSNDGVLQTNNGAPAASDRNEFSVKEAWSLVQIGNLITAYPPTSGVWAIDGHIRIYEYGQTLMIAEPPCYPVLPEYGIVPGSWTEIE